MTLGVPANDRRDLVILGGGLVGMTLALAAILGLRLPDGTFDGRCLDIDAGAGNTCVLP